MKNEKVLEMINAGQIEELKEMLKQEIYKSSLTTGAKQRLASMKRYFKYGVHDNRKAINMPFLDGDLTYFCDGYGCAITKETADGMKMYDEAEYGKYLNVSKFFPDDNNMETYYKVDLIQYIAKAKADGYKYSKNCFYSRENGGYSLKLFEHRFDISRLDKVLSILDDGEGFTLKIDPKKQFSPIVVSSGIGKGLILPYRFDGYDKGYVYNFEI